MGVPERPRGDGPGPLVAVIGGVVAALVLIWLVGIVITTLTFLVRIAVLVAVVMAGFWIWNKLAGD